MIPSINNHHNHQNTPQLSQQSIQRGPASDIASPLGFAQQLANAQPLERAEQLSASQLTNGSQPSNGIPKLETEATSEMQTLFRDFVGQTLFGELMSSMHKTHDKAAYFHGGQAEEIFQQQLDAVMVEEISESSAPQIADPMFELFQLSRNG